MESLGLLEQARARLIELCAARGIDRKQRVVVRSLSPENAIGEKASAEFAIKKGRERVIEASFDGALGQAFTDRPSEWEGTLDEAFVLDLRSVRDRAVFVAVLNSVLRSMGLVTGTRHCLDEDPARCGPEVAAVFKRRYGKARLGLIGFQPAILRALVEQWGSDSVRVVDLNPDNVGTIKSGVPVWDGSADLPRLVTWCEVGLATGSTLVNGTIEEIKHLFEFAGKPLVFYGNTISGAAFLLGLDHICPFSR